MKTIGDLIREKRQARGFTKQMLAEKTGIHINTISNWERGAFCPNILNCIDLADALGCTLDELFGREPENFETSEIIKFLEENQHKYTTGYMIELLKIKYEPLILRSEKRT